MTIFKELINIWKSDDLLSQAWDESIEMLRFSEKIFDKSIEAIRHKKYNWEGWMWHPERDKKFNLKLVRRAKKIFKNKI